ncbi:hypothetical protein VPH35_078927 [Triticum aestivum]|uniref:Uncharacterized protein n=1 Tax=Aegilops tauschii subsp. strangulata TaxID=200361 RepID=A0A453IL82_AEGTS
MMVMMVMAWRGAWQLAPCKSPRDAAGDSDLQSSSGRDRVGCTGRRVDTGHTAKAQGPHECRRVYLLRICDVIRRYALAARTEMYNMIGRVRVHGEKSSSGGASLHDSSLSFGRQCMRK